MHLTYWIHLSGLLLSLCRITLVQCLLLTLTPNTAEVGDDVQMYCRYVLTQGTYPRVTIEFKDSEIWELKSANGTISIGQSYEGRIQHSPQESYRNSVTITLNNVTKDDEGSYKCALNMPRKEPTEDKKNLTVYVPPRSLKVYVAPQAPYTESKKVSHSPNQYEPVYTVICTFFVSRDTDAHIWTYKIIRGNDTFQPIKSSVVNGNVYDVTLSNTQLTLTREDNGEKSVNCEVTWKKGTDREKIYSAQLETPLNVTFIEETIIMDVPDVFTEGETLSVTCRSGSANPPQHINWRINDYITEGIEVTYEPGEYNGQKTVSTLRVTAERWMNEREATCCHSVEEANHCKSSTLNVTFPPTTLTMTVSAPDNVTVGSIVTITCSTNSSNPVAQIRWTVNLGQHGTSSPATHDGEFGGKIYTSSYEFEVQESHLTKAITCKVYWKDVLLDELTQSYNLGTTTTSTTPETTTPAPSVPVKTTTNSYVSDTVTEKDTTTADVHPAAGANLMRGPDISLIIGIAVGVGGTVVIIAVILAVVLVRRRKGKGSGGKEEQELDMEQDRRASAHGYDAIEDSRVGNGFPKVESNGLYAEVQQTNFNTVSSPHLSDPAKSRDTPTPTVPPPRQQDQPLPASTTSPDTDLGKLYAEVNKLSTVKPPSARRQSTASDASSEPDIGPAISERRKSVCQNGEVSNNKLDNIDAKTQSQGQNESNVLEISSIPGKKSTNEDNAVEHSRNSSTGHVEVLAKPLVMTSTSDVRPSVSESLKTDAERVKKPAIKQKPSKPAKPPKQNNKPAQVKKTKDGSENMPKVYYNTREETLIGGVHTVGTAADANHGNDRKKMEKSPKEYYNTRGGAQNAVPQVSDVLLDNPYSEIPIETPINMVQDVPEYAEISNTRTPDRRPQKANAPLDRSSYNTVDFSKQQDDSDDDDDNDSD